MTKPNMIMWSFTKEKEQLLSNLINVASPYMNEIPMATFLRKLWQLDNTTVTTDVMGNVHASLSGKKPIHVGLVAHMDTVCIQITRILSDGLLRFRSIGLRPNVLLGMSVNVITRKGIICGIIGFDPISHTQGLTDADLWIDIGISGKDAASALVEIGDLAILEPNFNILNGEYISASGIDNRIGLFVINECLHWFAKNGAPLYLHFIGSVQEEMGLRGASICLAKQHLDACFIVDTDYATDTLSSIKDHLGELRLGNGVGMHKKADNNSVLQQLVCECAERANIPTQISLGRFVFEGTDASAIQLQSGGVATLNINIPCRYMHSPVELCHKSDVENAVGLLITSIQKIAEINKTSFIPGVD